MKHHRQCPGESSGAELREAPLCETERSVPVVQSSKHSESWLEAVINIQIDGQDKPQPGGAFTLTVSRTAVHLSPFLKPSNKERRETGGES